MFDFWKKLTNPSFELTIPASPTAIKRGAILLTTIGIVILVLFLFKRNQDYKNTEGGKPTASASIEPELASPSPTSSISPTPKYTPKPSASNSPKASASSTPSPSSTASPSVSPSPTPDTTPPVISSMGGPANGSTINFNSFCFPIMITDNVSHYPELYVRVKLDSDTWSAWSTDMSPCYSNVSNGQHSFSAQAKDQAGNESSIESRSFTVAVSPSPTP